MLPKKEQEIYDLKKKILQEELASIKKANSEEKMSFQEEKIKEKQLFLKNLELSHLENEFEYKKNLLES